jgi:hypothetical protein
LCKDTKNFWILQEKRGFFVGKNTTIYVVYSTIVRGIRWKRELKITKYTPDGIRCKERRQVTDCGKYAAERENEGEEQTGS